MKQVSNPFPYHFFPSANKKALTIVLYHGWGSSVGNYFDFADLLTSHGYHVIIPEIVHHDSRNKLENPFDPKVVQAFFWKTIFETIEEFQGFVSTLEIDKKKVVLVGSSMGGCIASGVFAKHPELGGLANMNGSGSFMLSEKVFREKENRPELTSQQKEEFKIYDPINKKAGRSPVFLMHGERDTVFPIDGQKHYYHHFAIDNNKGNIDFKTYQDINHTISDEMIEDLIGWLNTI